MTLGRRAPPPALLQDEAWCSCVGHGMCTCGMVGLPPPRLLACCVLQGWSRASPPASRSTLALCWRGSSPRSCPSHCWGPAGQGVAPAAPGNPGCSACRMESASALPGPGGAAGWAEHGVPPAGAGSSALTWPPLCHWTPARRTGDLLTAAAATAAAVRPRAAGGGDQGRMHAVMNAAAASRQLPGQ